MPGVLIIVRRRGSGAVTMEARNGPPGRCAVTKKIITKIVLTAPEMRTEKRDGDQIENEDGEIGWADLHRARF